MKALHLVTFILVIVGALNWGLIGLFNWNLVMAILGAGMVAKVVYILVGLSAVYLAATHMTGCKMCAKDGSMMQNKPAM